MYTEVKHMAKKRETKDKVLMARISPSLYEEMEIYKKENYNPTNAEVIRRALIEFILSYKTEKGKR